MGLDASVSCRCWRDGTTTAPPVPREDIVEDEDGYLDLAGPEKSHQADLVQTFAHWQAEQACGHKGMVHTDVRVSNWAGYRRFQQALADQGWQHFPTLAAHLPEGNYGLLPAQDAAAALQELACFAALAPPIDTTVLLDQDSGQTLMVSVAAYQGTSMWSQTFHAGVDPQGFFVLDPNVEPAAETFRSMRFTQHILADGRAEITDDDTGRRIILDSPLKSWSQGESLPSRLSVVTSSHEAQEEFAWILDALVTVLRAAVETGNPVRWY